MVNTILSQRIDDLRINTRKRAELIFAGAEDVDLAIKQAAERFKQNAIARGFKMTKDISLDVSISDERVLDILVKRSKDWYNLMTFTDEVISLLPGKGGVREMSQEDRQRLVEAYNRYRAAPYDWYYSDE
mgnify:FL=1